MAPALVQKLALISSKIPFESLGCGPLTAFVLVAPSQLPCFLGFERAFAFSTIVLALSVEALFICAEDARHSPTRVYNQPTQLLASALKSLRHPRVHSRVLSRRPISML